jgi:RecJ-like exonuclease
MKGGIKVLTRTTCSDCGGTGWVLHPGWADYQRYRDDFQADPRIVSPEQFFNGPVPDEEVECTVCSGKGYVESWVDVEELTGGQE